MDGREAIEKAKNEYGWVPLKAIKENTTSPLIEAGLNAFCFMGMLEKQIDIQSKEPKYRISKFAKNMGLTWKNLKLK